jgi:multidrug efflux system outer membrane protein
MRLWPALFLGLVLHAAAARGETPLSLDDAVQLARDRHPTVEAQRGQIVAADGRRQQALAGLLPFLTGSVAYQPTTPNLVATPALARQLLSSAGSDTVVDTMGMPVVVSCRTPGTGNCAPVPPAPTSWALQNFWMAEVGVSWTLWDWGKSLYGYRSARDLSRAADVGLRTAQRNVVLDAKLAYFGALAADQQVVVAVDGVKTYEAHLGQTAGLHDAGLRTGIDVATAESALASAKISLSRARAAQASARDQLLVALGEERWRDWRLVPETAGFEVQPGDAARARTSADTLTDTAFAQRTELQQLQLQEHGLVASTRSARGAYLPQLMLNVGPSWGGTELRSLTPNFTVGVSIGYPTSGMSPFLVHGQTREAEGNLIATRAQARATRDSVRQETSDARSALAAAHDEVLASDTLVAAAARQRALAEGRYQTGVGNVIELYDALLTDVNARFQAVQARFALATARARLQHALGEDD